VIERALGVNPRWSRRSSLDVARGTGSAVTDGLTQMLDDDEIPQILLTESDPPDRRQALRRRPSPPGARTT